MNVRPLHPALYLLGLGHRLSPIGLGRVVTWLPLSAWAGLGWLIWRIF